jgi:hypothetical protein
LGRFNDRFCFSNPTTPVRHLFPAGNKSHSGAY